MANVNLPDDTSGKAFKQLVKIVQQLADKYNAHTHNSTVAALSNAEKQQSGSTLRPISLKM